MAQLVFSYPFSPDPSTGSFKKLEQGNDLYKGQQISAFLRTYLNERPVLQQFGTQDPTFDEFDADAFAEAFVAYYDSDSILLKEIEIVESEKAVVEINVTFE